MLPKRPSVSVQLDVVRPDRTQPSYTLTLRSAGCGPGVGKIDVTPEHRQQWQAFLDSYVQGVAPGDGELTRFGKGLFTDWIGASGLGTAWAVLRESSSQRAIHLTVEFGPATAELAPLP